MQKNSLVSSPKSRSSFMNHLDLTPKNTIPENEIADEPFKALDFKKMTLKVTKRNTGAQV